MRRLLWEKDADGEARGRVETKFDRAARALDDAAHDREPQAEAVGFGGVKGIAELGQACFGHAAAVVGNFDHDAGFERRVARAQGFHEGRRRVGILFVEPHSHFSVFDPGKRLRGVFH